MSEEQQPTAPVQALSLIRAVCADPALALIIALVAGLVIASLAAAGINTMNLAYALLGLAWIIAVGGSFLVPWPFQHKHRAIFAALLGIMLIIIGLYETEHYEKPPTAADIAQEVAKRIPLQPPQNPEAPLNEPASIKPSTPTPPTYSTIAKAIYSCALLDEKNPRSIKNSKGRFRTDMQVEAQAVNFTVAVTDVLGGIRFEQTPKTTASARKPQPIGVGSASIGMVLDNLPK